MWGNNTVVMLCSMFEEAFLKAVSVFVISLSDDVFGIKTKYHNFIVILFILTHILSYQDGIIVWSLFLPLFAKVVSWFWILFIPVKLFINIYSETFCVCNTL